MRSLRSALLHEPLPRLMAIAEAWDVALDAATASELSDAILARARDHETVMRARDSLPSPARDALAALLAADGRMAVAAFERRFGAIRPMGPARLERERPWHNPANPAETLWYRGFIQRAFDRGTPPAELIFVPTELAEALAPRAPLESEEQPAADFSATLTPAGDELDAPLLDDAVTLLALVQAGAAARGPDALREAAPAQLRDPDPARLSFLLHLLRRMDLLRAADEPGLRLNARTAAAWLHRGASDQLAGLREAWRTDEGWNDLLQVEGLAFDMAHAWHNDPVRERAAVLDMLDAYARAEGVPVRADARLVAWAQARNPDFARTDGRYDTWHIRDAASGAFLRGFEHWDRIEGGLIRYIIDGPLRWLAGESAAGAGAGVTVSEDAVVSIPARLRFERFQLARIAEFRDRALATYRYVLTPASLGRAREQGIDAGRVLDFLQRTAGRALPTHLAQAVARWDERGVEARAEAVVLLRMRDGAALETLLKHPALRGLASERIANNALTIRPADVERVRAAGLLAGVLVDVA